MSQEKRMRRKIADLRKKLGAAEGRAVSAETNLAAIIVKSNEVAKHHQQMVLVLASLALREPGREIRITHEEFGRVDQRAKMQTPHEDGVLVFRYDDSEVVANDIAATEARDFDESEAPESIIQEKFKSPAAPDA